jgi:transcriptional regulator with XRE-family HTH domain
MNRLKYYRTQKHLLQRELAELSGVKYATITKLESGVNDLNKAQLDTVYKLAKALEVSMEDLVEDNQVFSVGCMSLPEYLWKQ